METGGESVPIITCKGAVFNTIFWANDRIQTAMTRTSERVNTGSRQPTTTHTYPMLMGATVAIYLGESVRPTQTT